MALVYLIRFESLRQFLTSQYIPLHNDVVQGNRVPSVTSPASALAPTKLTPSVLVPKLSQLSLSSSAMPVSKDAAPFAFSPPRTAAAKANVTSSGSPTLQDKERAKAEIKGQDELSPNSKSTRTKGSESDTKEKEHSKEGSKRNSASKNTSKSQGKARWGGDGRRRSQFAGDSASTAEPDCTPDADQDTDETSAASAAVVIGDDRDLQHESPDSKSKSKCKRSSGKDKEKDLDSEMSEPQKQGSGSSKRNGDKNRRAKGEAAAERRRRENFTSDQVNVLKRWLNVHWDGVYCSMVFALLINFADPYPNTGAKSKLAQETKLSYEQV